MTKEGFEKFSIVLRYKSPGSAPAWDTGCAQYYFMMLADVPDSVVMPLMRAVDAAYKFRPSPEEIKETWRQLCAPNDAVTPETVAAQIYALRDKWGAQAVPVPGFEERFPSIRGKGEPNWTDPVKRQVIAAMGGWVTFCEEETPAGVQRGQLLKIAAAVIGGQGQQTLNELRLEYRERQAALASQNAPSAGHELGDGGPLVSIGDGRNEAGPTRLALIKVGGVNG